MGYAIIDTSYKHYDDSGRLDHEQHFVNTYPDDADGEGIHIKYFSDKIERLRYIDGKSDWIDLQTDSARCCDAAP